MYAQMLPVLQARESIHRVNEFAYAFGAMDEGAGREFMRDLTENAIGLHGKREKPHRPSSPEEMARLFGDASVDTVMEP